MQECVGISAFYLIISTDSNCGRIESAADFKRLHQLSTTCVRLCRRRCVSACVSVWVCVKDRGVVSLMYGLEELSLVFADSGVVDLLRQLGVLVDEPGLPQHISC